MSTVIKKGIAWTAIEKFSLQIVQFVIGIVIARFISPDEYGILGVLMVFVTISQVFIESGLGSALIFKNNLEDNDLQTTFTFNFIISFVLVILIALFAVPLEKMIGIPDLSCYLIISIFVLIPNAFIVVPTSILRVKMDFKAIAVSNVVSTLLSGSAGVACAIMGLGVWALVIQLLSKSTLQFLLMMFQCHWIPKFRFNKDSFLEMYKYSFAIFGTSCISKITDQGISLFIARILTPYSLGIFTRGNQFATLAGTSLGTIFSTVLFPAFSANKNDEKHFQSILWKMVEYQGAFIVPIFIFLAVLSKPIVVILLTEKWIDVVPVLQILCLGRIFSTISIATEQAICSVGRSDLEFKQQFYKLMLKVVFIAIGFIWGLLGIAVADALSTLISFFITNYYANKCIKFPSSEQLKILMPFVVYATLSSIIGFYIVRSFTSVWLQLIICAVIMFAVYIIMLFVYHRKFIYTLLQNANISR